MGDHRFPNPTQRAASVLFVPQFDILGVTERGRIEIVQTDGEEWFAIGSDEKPVIWGFSQCKETF
jgi:hypothetical protein